VIRFYRARFSTNVERVALALAHKGLEAESVWIDKSDRSAVERVSGQELVPVIADGGTVVADSMQIIAYLEERYPRAPLYPDDEARRAEMLLFVDWFNRVWKVAPNAIDAELDAAWPDNDRVAALGAEMTVALDRFEVLLTGRDHLFGDDFSAADCAAFPFVKYALLPLEPEDEERYHAILGEYQPLGDDHPRLAAWIERVDGRPRVA